VSGCTDLPALLSNMKPELRDEEYVFCTVPRERLDGLQVEPIGWFREAEGVSLIVESAAAEAAGLSCDFVCRLIVLSVHSGLDAVGFSAAVTARLAAAGIGANVVAGYYHDYLFVPAADAGAAMAALLGLMSEARGNAPQ
jgi:hypothetical protein